MFIRVHPWLKKFLPSAAWLWCAATSFAAAPEIESVSPRAVRPGVATEITLSGSDLGEARQLWTSFPAKVVALGEGRFRITALATNGLGAVRAFGSNGVSPLALVGLDELPAVVEAKSNQTRSTAQPLDWNSAVEGRVPELGYDWFRVRATKGQRVPVEILAARLGSKLDSVLRVFNTRGRELARNDDAPGTRGDSALVFTAPEDGDYFIEVRDVNYGGGSAFFYRLRVGGASLVNAPFLNTTTDRPPTVPEKEPNDTVTKAMPVSWPGEVRGSFAKPGDRDRYTFIAKKNERLEFRARTRSLGSPCDAVLQLDSADGQRLARSNPSAADEGMLTFSFPSNGTYRLTVQETSGAHGSNLFYRVSGQSSAGFSLAVDSERVNVLPGKTFELKITAARTDHKGAIKLSLEDLPGALILTNGVIAEGRSNVTMKVRAPESLAPGTWQQFRVTGTGARSNDTVHVRASTAPALRRQWSLLLHAPPEFDGVIALGVTAP